MLPSELISRSIACGVVTEQIINSTRLRHHVDATARVLSDNTWISRTAAYVHVHEIPSKSEHVDLILRLPDGTRELLFFAHICSPARGHTISWQADVVQYSERRANITYHFGHTDSIYPFVLITMQQPIVVDVVGGIDE